jgi:hypothetical protein
LKKESKKWEDINKKVVYYKKFLKNLLIIYPTKDKLIASKDFKFFVNSLNKDFFFCE